MKKVITLALALMMVCSMSVTAFAATTTLTTTVPEATYTLNIPANQEIPFGTTYISIGNVTVTDAVGFAAGKNLDVTITYDAFTAEGSSTKIPYALNLFAEAQSQYNDDPKMDIPSGATITFKGKSNGTTDTAVILASTTGTGIVTEYAAATDLIFTATSEDWGKALAGEYSATITFTAEVVAE